MKYSVHMLEIRFYPEEIGLGFRGIQLVVFITLSVLRAVSS